MKKASNDLRKLAGELMSKTAVVPCYRCRSFLRIVPRFSDIKVTYHNLIGLSNGVFRTGNPSENSKRAEEIKASLSIPKELFR